MNAIPDSLATRISQLNSFFFGVRNLLSDTSGESGQQQTLLASYIAASELGASGLDCHRQYCPADRQAGEKLGARAT
jgi:hypothetical protein